MIEAATQYFCKPRWRLFIHVLAGPEEAYVLAAQAAARNYYAVLVAGGDGTINEVAGALALKKTLLGVIPSGTGNGFARALGIPLNFKKACRALANGTEIKCDVGFLDNKRVFVNICGVGMDAWIAHRANDLRWIGRYSGFLRYFLAGLHGVLSFRASELKVRVGKETFQETYLLAVIANSEQYGFGTVIAPGASVNDGDFDIVLISPLSLAQVFKNFFRLYQHKPLLGSTRLKGQEVEISSVQGHKVPLHLDGESAGHAPMKLKLKRKALNVLVP